MGLVEDLQVLCEKKRRLTHIPTSDIRTASTAVDGQKRKKSHPSTMAYRGQRGNTDT